MKKYIVTHPETFGYSSLITDETSDEIYDRGYEIHLEVLGFDDEDELCEIMNAAINGMEPPNTSFHKFPPPMDMPNKREYMATEILGSLLSNYFSPSGDASEDFTVDKAVRITDRLIAKLEEKKK